MKTGWATLALLLCADAARPAPPLTVKYRSATSVYLSGGRADGLAVGDRLRVKSGGTEVGELEVVFLAEHSASSRVIRETRAVKSGDAVERIGPAPAPATSTVPTYSAAPPTPATLPRGPTEAAPRPRARVSGGVSVGWARFWDGAEVPRDSEQRTVRFDLSLRDLAGQPYTIRIRGRHRQDDRMGAAFTSARRDRLYEASLAYEPVGGRFRGQIGRIGGTSFLSLGTIDGAVGQYQLGSGLVVGGFYGRNSDRDGLGIQSSGPKFGGFLRLAPPHPRNETELVISGVREFGPDFVSREFLGLQGQVRTGAFWFHQRWEVDWNRDWRREVDGGAFQLSEVSTLARYRPSPARSFTVYYDRRRNYKTAETRALPDALVDHFLRQGLRATLDFGRPGRAGFWLGGGVRLREAEERATYSATAGLRLRGLHSLATGAEASAYTNVYTEGVLVNVRASRSFGRRGHQGTLSYGASQSRFRRDGTLRFQQWVRASAYANLAQGVFVISDLDWGFGPDLQGPRVGVELGYRR